ncbi:putative serine/threonine-protein kinase samkC-like isoform X2 [Hibiscus syriacus]|uniref:Serine/threonine-protein kinase samkC-like isoform X2 n=1 Tax=Hibiscus syriacus TaxID=106335 RepID=A0A6A2WBU8_HIBSY|nr:putative serine/threonine-protein kinase samkC-like isoform X2 [Hibiscus syriacus]
MGKNEDQNLQQREQNVESGSSQGHPGFFCGRCWMVLSSFSFRCVFVFFLSLSVLLPGIFWILPSRSVKSGFDAKQAINLSVPLVSFLVCCLCYYYLFFAAPVHVHFTLEKPVSELVQHIRKLEYDIYEEIGVPYTKVAILSMHKSGASNSTYVVFGVLPDPVNRPINPVYLSVLRSSLIELFLRHSNLTLTTSVFGQPSELEILKFPGGITVNPLQSASICWLKPLQALRRRISVNNSVFGKVKSVSLSSYLNGTLHPTSATPPLALFPGPSMSRYPTFSPSRSPAPASKKHHLPHCCKCKSAAPSSHSPIHSPRPESGSYPTFPPLISPKPSSSAMHPPPPLPGSKLSPDLPPLPSVSYGSHPGEGMDSNKGPVSAPLAQSQPVLSPSSIATDVIPNELWLSALLGFVTFHLHL